MSGKRSKDTRRRLRLSEAECNALYDENDELTAQLMEARARVEELEKAIRRHRDDRSATYLYTPPDLERAWETVVCLLKTLRSEEE